MAYGLWEVSGRVIIPGTRKSGSFGPVRIGDKDRQTASKHLGKMLNEKFRKELRGDHRFSDGFALMNLQWKDLSVKSGAPTTAQAVQVAEKVRAQEVTA